MNAQNWLLGTIATLCWFLGSAVPAAPPAATPTEAAEGASDRSQLIVLVLTKDPAGADVPVNGANVILFLGEDSQQQHLTASDGRAAFSLPAGAPEQATLRVVAANLKSQQKKIQSLQDAAGEPQKVFMEKQDAELTDD